MDFRLWHRRFCALKFAAGNGTIKIKISLPSGRGVPEVCIRDLFSSQLRQKHGISLKTPVVEIEPAFCGLQTTSIFKNEQACKVMQNAKEAWLERSASVFFECLTAKLENNVTCMARGIVAKHRHSAWPQAQREAGCEERLGGTEAEGLLWTSKSLWQDLAKWVVVTSSSIYD